MNWYELYRISYNVSKNDVLALNISHNIFFFVKENLGRNLYTEIIVDKECKLYLYIFYNRREELRYGTFNIEAFTDISKNRLFNPYMMVNLFFSNQFSELYFDTLNYIIYDAIKHELDHYRQYKNNEDVEENPLIPGENLVASFINMRDSILLEQELVPYVKGLVFTSKKQNVPLPVIIDKNLDGLFFTNNIERKNQILNSIHGKRVREIMLEIKNSTINKAKQLYPYLRKRI